MIVRIFRFSLFAVLIFTSGPLCIFHHLYKLLSTATGTCHRQLVISTQKMYQKKLAIVCRPQDRICSVSFLNHITKRLSRVISTLHHRWCSLHIL